MDSGSQQVRVTSDNYVPVVNICTIIFFTLAVLTILGRLFTKGAVIRGLNREDYAILLSLVVYGGQTGATIVATNNGIGRRANDLSPDDQQMFMKALLASQMLYVISIILGKISIASFVRDLSPSLKSINFGFALLVGMLVWGFSSIFAIAFQCHTPSTWDFENGRCINQMSFWSSFFVITILTDLALVVWPSVILIQLQASASRKFFIIACFAARLAVVAVSAGQIAAMYAMRGTTDVNFDLWTVTILSELVLALNLMSACIPFLQPFLTSMQSGCWRSDDLRRRRVGPFSTQAKPELWSTHKIFSRKRSTPKQVESETSNSNVRLRPDDPMSQATIRAGTPRMTSETHRDPGTIDMTTTWTVENGPRFAEEKAESSAE